uniref:DNA ligase n=1 Tax=Timema californicum TaxID=61474 RepID=A0A7R9IVG6_TIMCA|nr:unnamed protein product [Timema californicum]
MATMSDDAAGENEEPQVEEKKFFAERAKFGRANCKKCKQKLEAGKLRLAKAGFNPFGPGLMKMWHHVPCLFDVFSRQRKTTPKIESPDDIEGWSDLEEEDQDEILQFLPGCSKGPTTQKKEDKEKKDTLAATPTQKKKTKKTKDDMENSSVIPSNSSGSLNYKNHKDNSFREFRRLCADLANASSYTAKTAIVQTFFTKGTDGDTFKGDLLLWCRLLLPGHVKRVYNLQSKQLIKLFSRLFKTDHDDMLEDLEKGDVAETVATFFDQSKHCKPSKKSTLTLYEVDEFLKELSALTKEDEQTEHFKKIATKCTSNDLKMIIRLIKHDLRINAGPKHILGAVHPDAYQAFQTSRDLEAVLSRAATKTEAGVSSPSKKKTLTIRASLMTPVLPMLAEACKSVEQAMKKCPNGMYSEIKYDGERVQVHKQGHEYKYFSRSLKPVLPHKSTFLMAFPHGKDLILDCEVLMIDTETGKLLPFGSLGKHKKNAFSDANVCLFVFDCIYYNGEVLLQKPIKERREILLNNMTEIPNHIMFSEVEEIHCPKDLEAMITKVLKLGLEGLVLKDLMSIYEPGKRHWLKVKKDYLFGGSMADSADLVVLGAWFGTGQKGGMMSVFLMGCYDPARKKWCTVTKVHTGHDDKTLERIQDELQMVKISKDASKVPDWLLCTKTMIPDFVAKDPKEQPVWEISGAEFTQHEVHTADGISIRFPRVTKIRDDKNWKTATSLPELKNLYKTSKDNQNFSLPSSSDNKEITATSRDSETNTSKKANGSRKGDDVTLVKKPMLTAKDIKTSNTFNNDTEVHSKSNTLTDDKERVSKVSSNKCNGKYKPKAVKHRANDSSNEDQDEQVTPAKKRKKHSSSDDADDNDDNDNKPMIPKLRKKIISFITYINFQNVS